MSDPELIAALRRIAEPGRDSTGQDWACRRGYIRFGGLDRREFSDPIALISVSDGKAIVDGRNGSLALNIGGFDLLEASIEAWSPKGETSRKWLCGYLSYELCSELEHFSFPVRSKADLPDLFFGLYEAFENDRANGHPFPASSSPAGVTSSPSEEEFRTAVARTVARIYAGEVFQVNVCRKIETSLDPSQIQPFYSKLLALNPASHAAFVQLSPGTAVLSVSPECFLRLDGRQVCSFPIKGTRPRGKTAEEDARLARELAESEKDRAELAMIVDVTRNDLGRVCEPGSIRVVSHAQPMRLPTVHHTFSEVSGCLRRESGVTDLLRAAFPPASITGAPKIRAIQIAAMEEGQRRGPCMGAIGWISLDAEPSMEFSVAIRTAVASQGRVWYLAGCGITAESDPQAELEESSAKAAAFLRALA